MELEKATTEGLVMKPQYDLNKFMPGKAIYVQSINASDPFYNFKANCLVVDAEPLKLKLVYVEKPKNHVSRHLDHDYEEERYSNTKTIDLPIDLVASGKIKIEFLQP